MEKQVTETTEDQITFKDVFRQVKYVGKVILKNWKIVILFCVLGYGIGYLIDTYRGRRVIYEAEIVFNLGNGSGGGSSFGGMAGLGSFLPMSGMNTDASLFSGDNFIYLAKSRPVVQKALMKYVEVNGDSLIMANFFLDSCRIKEFELKKREDWVHTFNFEHNNPQLYTGTEKRLLNDLTDLINNFTELEQEDPKSSFMTLRVNIANETFSKIWAEELLETLEQTYTDNKTAKTRKSLYLTEKRVDSLGRALGKVENSLAREMDISETMIFNEGKIGVKRNERSATFLQSLYAQALQSLESLRMSLIEESVLFTIIEPVKTPLDSVADLAFYEYICLAVGLIVALIIIWIKHTYSEAKTIK